MLISRNQNKLTMALLLSSQVTTTNCYAVVNALFKKGRNRKNSIQVEYLIIKELEEARSYPTFM